MLAAAEPCFWEFAVEVWRTKVARSERYEFLIYRVRSFLQLPYILTKWC